MAEMQDWAESATAIAGEVVSPTEVNAASTIASATGCSRASGAERVWFSLALVLALVADAIQWLALPLFIGGVISPVNDILDAIVAVFMVGLLGRHWQFLPSFIAELVPTLNLAPTWTIAVLWVWSERAGAR